MAQDEIEFDPDWPADNNSGGKGVQIKKIPTSGKQNQGEEIIFTLSMDWQSSDQVILFREVLNLAILMLLP